MRRVLLSLLALCTVSSHFLASAAYADNQVDKAVFFGYSSPGRVGIPSQQSTGIRIAGSVDFSATVINVWAMTSTGWQFLPGSGLQVTYSATDSAFYGKPVYSYVVTASKAASFSIQYIDVDFLNPSTNQWVKLSWTKGYTTFAGDTLTKKQF